jgi:hypothetical protein
MFHHSLISGRNSQASELIKANPPSKKIKQKKTFKDGTAKRLSSSRPSHLQTKFKKKSNKN